MSDPTMLDDAFGIAANMRAGTKHIAGDDGRNMRGGQCWIEWLNNGWGCRRNPMLARSRGARWISIWLRAGDMQEWRVKFIPPELRGRVLTFGTRAQCQAELDRIQAIWAAHPDLVSERMVHAAQGP